MQNTKEENEENFNLLLKINSAEDLLLTDEDTGEQVYAPLMRMMLSFIRERRIIYLMRLIMLSVKSNIILKSTFTLITSFVYIRLCL